MSRPSSSNNYYGKNTRTCFVCKKEDCQLTKYTKKKYNKAREGFKRHIYQYLADNNIDNNFNKDIVLTTTSGNFFYNNCGVKHFITLNGLIPIKTAKNIVMSINNNAFIHSLTGSMEPSNTESSTVRRSNKVNTKNLIVDINFLDYYFNNNGQDLALPSIFPYGL